jgi:hypothetical protein
MVQIPGLSSLPCLAHRGVAYRVPRPRSRAPTADLARRRGRTRPQASAAASLLGSGNLARLAPLYQMMMTMLQTRFQPMAWQQDAKNCMTHRHTHTHRTVRLIKARPRSTGGVPFFFLLLLCMACGCGDDAARRRFIRRGFVRTPWAWVTAGCETAGGGTARRCPRTAIDPIDLSLARNDFVSPRTRRRHRDWGCARARRVPLLRRTNPARN